MKTDWNQASLERLFGQMDEDFPMDWPLVIDCNGYGRTNSVIRAVGAICCRLESAGFFTLPEMCLIVPTDTLPDNLAGHIDVYESSACDNTAYLFTVGVGGFPIITLPNGMTWLDWFCAVQQGKKLSVVNTMPWAHAKFVNWGKKYDPQ